MKKKKSRKRLHNRGTTPTSTETDFVITTYESEESERFLSLLNSSTCEKSVKFCVGIDSKEKISFSLDFSRLKYRQIKEERLIRIDFTPTNANVMYDKFERLFPGKEDIHSCVWLEIEVKKDNDLIAAMMFFAIRVALKSNCLVFNFSEMVSFYK